MEMITIEDINTKDDNKLIKIFKDINISAFLDKWGPLNVIQVYDPDINMQGILVIDNTILGPSCGGIKISPLITPRQIFQHARKMTLSCALINLDLGGAAAGIRANPFEIDKIKFIKSFAKRISPYVPEQFIACPDLYVGQEEMAAFADEVGDRQGATGKPENMDGIPYELGVIGLGMGITIETVIETSNNSSSLPNDISELKIAIQGFEHIGQTVAKFLANKGAKIVAISDLDFTIYDSSGIDINKILESYSETNEKQVLKGLMANKSAKKLTKNDIIKITCDIFVPSTANSIITDENVHTCDAKCIIEGINDPITDSADLILHKNNVLVLPDILTTAGGAISSHAEHNRIGSESAFSLIESRIRETTEKVIGTALESDISPRRIAKEIAKERILQAMEVQK